MSAVAPPYPCNRDKISHYATKRTLCPARLLSLDTDSNKPYVCGNLYFHFGTYTLPCLDVDNPFAKKGVPKHCGVLLSRFKRVPIYLLVLYEIIHTYISSAFFSGEEGVFNNENY